MSFNSCFLCLEKCKQKICPNCECYCHSKCYGRYLHAKTHIYTIVLHDNKIRLSTPYSVMCPQCRKQIYNVKPITRSNTKLGRKMLIIKTIKNTFSNVSLNTHSKQEIVSKFRYLCSKILLLKEIIFEDLRFVKIISEKLTELYYDFDWKCANIYHILLYGIHIK